MKSGCRKDGEGMALMQSERMDWPGCSVWPCAKHYISCSCGMVWRSYFPRSLQGLLSFWWGGKRPQGVLGSAFLARGCVFCVFARRCETQQTWRSSLKGGWREKARWHGCYNDHPAHSVLPWFSTSHFSSEKLVGDAHRVRLSSWFKCSMLHPGHLCLLSNNRGGFWEVCRRPGSERDE